MPLTDQSIFAYNEVLDASLMEAPTKPNLVGVGTGRAGTTSLYYIFRDAPDVFITPIKETNFFGIRGSEGLTLADYYRFFMQANGERYISEISPVYLSHPNSAELMHVFNPEMKIIITLREPVGRTISQYRHHRNHPDAHLEPLLTGDNPNEYLLTGIRAVQEGRVDPLAWYSPGRNVRSSYYARDLMRYRNLFGDKQLLVLVYEDLDRDPTIWSSAVSDFLGVSITLPDVIQVDRNSSRETAAGAKILPSTYEAMKEAFRSDVLETSEMLGRDLEELWG